MKYTARGRMTISVDVTVDVPDEDLEGADEDTIAELVKELASEAEALPSELCIQCSGYTSQHYGGRADDGSSSRLKLDGEVQFTEVEKS